MMVCKILCKTNRAEQRDTEFSNEKSSVCRRRSSAVRPRGEDAKDTADCPWWIGVCSVFSSPPPPRTVGEKKRGPPDELIQSGGVSGSDAAPKAHCGKERRTGDILLFFFAATANVSFTTLRPVKSGGKPFFTILPLQSNYRPFFPLKADLMCE